MASEAPPPATCFQGFELADASSADSASADGVYVVVCAPADGLDPAVDVRPQLTQAILQAGWELLELRAVGMSLEDIFLQLTVDERETGFSGNLQGCLTDPVSAEEDDA